MVPVVLLRNRGVHTRSIKVLTEVEYDVSRNFKATSKFKEFAIQVFFSKRTLCPNGIKLQREILSKVPINDRGYIKMPC
jgi:hypothetical protein